MREAVIVDAVRTPIGRRRGCLSRVMPSDLAASTLRGLVERVGISPGLVDDVIMGCVTQTGEQGANIGRLAVLTAGFPVEVPAVTLNRMCGSSQQAVHFGAQAIMAGSQNVVIAAGVEGMSRVPLTSDFPAEFSRHLTDRHEVVSQGFAAEMMAERWGIDRGQLDEFSYQSHVKAHRATEQGCFSHEILPISALDPEGQPVSVTADEGIRPDTTVAILSSLKPAFKSDGVIHAGNASQISDGAAAVLLVERERARALGLRPLARIVAMTVVGSDPTLMLSGPIPATHKVLQQAGLQLSQMDVIEINEAFASVVLAWAHELKPDMARVNPSGGAIALGHPVGASGARIMATLAWELQRTGGRYGLQTMCIGHGMATATIIERICCDS